MIFLFIKTRLAVSHDHGREAGLLFLKPRWATPDVQHDVVRFVSHCPTNISHVAFVARMRDGRIVVIPVEAQISTGSTVSFDEPHARGGRTGAHLEMGEAKPILKELRAGESARAKKEATLVSRIDTAATYDDLVYTTTHVAWLAEMWNPERVGGDIDQIYLGPKGIKWLKRKPNCRGKF